MESARAPHKNGQRSPKWLPEMDRILLVGMKHGPEGVREATSRVLSLGAGLTRADCWKRLRFLRGKNGTGNYLPPRQWPIEVQELLRDGYLEGGEKKRQALKAVRGLYPGLPSNGPSRFARRQGWLPKLTQIRRPPWTQAEEQKLWELAGYETAAKIGERLGRSEGAVRFRLKSLGLSVKVKDGWSFRALHEMLHVGPSKLRRLIAEGLLRVRDPRISSTSLTGLLDRRIASAKDAVECGASATTRQKLHKRRAYSWSSAAKILGADIEQVRNWITTGELKIVDGFVTERAFQDFCKKPGSELNFGLLGDEVRDWLVEGYSMRPLARNDAAPIPGNEKHALIIRQCPTCRRPMRGNIFFRHVKTCKRTGAIKDGLSSSRFQHEAPAYGASSST
jgi:hypothetical protein